MELGGGAGGATILDLHSGALSFGRQFVDVYRAAKGTKKTVMSETDLAAYAAAADTVKGAVQNAYNASPIHLTKPTFFSRITSKPAVTEHDEYWHSHVDKSTYGSFDYTCLLYLSDYGHNGNFTGGQFVFEDKGAPGIVEPRYGRVSCFTSGAENPHHVEHVTSGTRLALTIAFTCNSTHAIPQPSTRAATTGAAIPEQQ